MNAYLFNDENIISLALPVKKIGNFWMTNKDSENICNIRAEDGKWILSGSENSVIQIDNNQVTDVEIKNKMYYTITKNEKKYIVFFSNAVDKNFNKYKIKESNQIIIGNKSGCDIITNIPLFEDKTVIIKRSKNKWNVLPGEMKCYVNNVVCEGNDINVGDVLNIFGFKILFLLDSIVVSNLFNNIISNKLLIDDLMVEDDVINEEILDKNLYEEKDYFLRSPRLRKIIETYQMKIDSPPAKQPEDETPMIYTLGPMLTMGTTSIVTMTSTFVQISNGQRELGSSIPTLVIAFAMLLSMLVWPFLMKRYQKKLREKKEQERLSKYGAYLKEKGNDIYLEYCNQKKIHEENLLSTDVCYDMVINKRRSLWSRKFDQNDFLTCRVGIGETLFDANINYHSEDFSLDDDSLKNSVDVLINTHKIIKDVPIGYSFLDNHLTDIYGVFPKYLDFVNNLILQMIAYHSYDELKIVVFTNKKNSKRWDNLRNLPHMFSNDKSIRFFASDTEEMQVISNYLIQEFNNREILMNLKDKENKKKFIPHYFMIIDDIDLARKVNIFEKVVENPGVYGFSILMLEEKLSKVPSEVNKFFVIGEKTSMILDSSNNKQIRFVDDVKDIYDMKLCSKILSNLPVYVDSKEKHLPNTITFLEMFQVGQVDQLNALNRWKNNDSTKSLKAPLGVGDNGDLFYLDIHEKYHGPHGLIAGMTGSGKSELIITYVLSLMINYSPEDVAFVLIDYKGGGLTGAFETGEDGVSLPHIVGTITNLDKTEINRALASIQSELKRRQEKFNEVRVATGESTIDIYKYQKLYKSGVIKEPMPHLLIISDEFAELKDQQPEFMDDLISTARIGRSLGVHLILATQKPSGVVDGQIWSNSKFKICLKVQDKQDSMEMIKCADAAELKNVGRFYLQVGYNELFLIGQAAWAGASYIPSKEFKKPIDKNLYFIDNTGSVIKTINNSFANKMVKFDGEELPNIVEYIKNISSEMSFDIRKLWLDRIPSKIHIDNLIKKYNFNKRSCFIDLIVGEYDNPNEQMQGLLTLPITEEGNALIYGMSDSGKDELLRSLVYGAIKNYDSSELNLYLVDFGAETLINFDNAPQVGNVIINGETEKLENLIKMLNSEMIQRKKLFTSYNGNYIDYIKKANRKLPNILVFINSIEVVSEVYPNIIDSLAPLVREGTKYGISFVITTNSQTSIKFKISQCCKQVLCLQLNSDNEYKDILGRTEGLVPSNIIGRGLVKLDRVCEFQSATVGDDNEYELVNELIDELNATDMMKARSIPIMPDTITIDYMIKRQKGISGVPIGINKENLISNLYDFSKNVINLVSYNDENSSKLFVYNFLKVIENVDTYNKVVIDASNYFEGFNYKIDYVNSKFNEIVNNLQVINNQIQIKYNENNKNIRSIKNLNHTMVFIIGISKFIDSLDDEHRNIFKEIVNNNKETLKINFVFCDVPSNYKKYEYEEWYKNNVNNSNGIWIGSGIGNQFVIKTSIAPSGVSSIDNEYAVVVKNGMPIVIKVINEIKDFS
ncbi:MAG: type VII secretion protein EssC [Bacilli bacterium]|nr:type VII secretion protein EssC [Bacilli bacterium]